MEMFQLLADQADLFVHVDDVVGVQGFLVGGAGLAVRRAIHREVDEEDHPSGSLTRVPIWPNSLRPRTLLLTAKRRRWSSLRRIRRLPIFSRRIWFSVRRSS